MLIAVSASGEGYTACEGEANKECEAKMLTGCVCYFCPQHNMNFLCPQVLLGSIIYAGVQPK